MTDDHGLMRGAIVDVNHPELVDVHHPELDETFSYVGSRWYSPMAAWWIGPRAPLIGEHTSEVLADVPKATPAPPAAPATPATPAPPAAPAPVAHGGAPTAGERKTSRVAGPVKAFALDGLRVVDMSWFLASAGAGRFLAAFGAEVIKVEHLSRLDQMRWSQKCPPGGRGQRDAATEPIPPPDAGGNPNRGGASMEINAGKLGISLNLKSPRAKDLLRNLVEVSDILIEGFSPGTMDRMGLGYEDLKEINPKLIYVQQSGLGQFGLSGGMRTFGPTAAGFAGTSEMSGLPDPYPLAGIGYSHLDWFGAHSVANAVLAALYRRHQTGEGVYIDASQVEVGLYFAGTSVLDHSTNDRQWSRCGNRSPFKLAASPGAYRTRGSDRWIAIACFDDEQWKGLLSVLTDIPSFSDPRYSTIEGRSDHQNALDETMNAQTQGWDPFELMERLQSAGVPAGVCQTAQDRYERDPQLGYLRWLEELPQTEIGPGRSSGSPSISRSRRHASVVSFTDLDRTTQKAMSTSCMRSLSSTSRRSRRCERTEPCDLRTEPCDLPW